MARFHAGAISQALFNSLARDDFKQDFFDANEYLRWLAEFECETVTHRPSAQAPDSYASVLVNILERGVPTLASPYVEQVLSERLGVTSQVERDDQIEYRFCDDVRQLATLQDAIQQSLVAVNSDLNTSQYSDLHFDSDAERMFLVETLVQQFGKERAWVLQQLVVTQRPLDTIVDNAVGFKNQRVDFAWEFPCSRKGIVVEIDGAQHEDAAAKSLDRKRDKAIKDKGWDVIRIPTSQLDALPNKQLEKLAIYLGHPYALFAAKSLTLPAASNTSPDDMIRQLVLVPMAVARIQRVLCELVLAGHLSWTASQWHIAIYERDVPCAWLAIADFIKTAGTLHHLVGQSLPSIHLTVVSYDENTSPLAEFPVNVDFQHEFILERDIASLQHPMDVFNDCAMLERPGWRTLPTHLKDLAAESCTVTIRTIHFPISSPRVRCAEPINYETILPKRDDLVFFLQYLFRKFDFRPGQEAIVRRALRRKDVIGLMPTGGGKSICYQLVSMLQPGMSVVVDPLKSLMLDQVENLLAVGFSNATYINSSLEPKERQRREELMVHGRYQFAFISPERMQIVKFRDHLKQMGGHLEPVLCVYAIVDEAHCVSEWGHDFRTAYLRLGTNLRTWLPTWDNYEVAIIGLTGTASYDVLSDAQRELGIADEDAIIQPDTLERKELAFEIISVPVKTSDLKGVGKAKTQRLIDLFQNLPEYFINTPFNSADFQTINETETCAGIIFCPYARDKTPFGVKPVRDSLIAKFPNLKEISATYAGSSDDEVDDKKDEELRQTQSNFKRNKLALLVATKAFGMGIDKPNIRYTIHFNIPMSIEAFYQEAGRAGRDRKPGVCFILLAQGKNWKDENIVLGFHQNAFKGVGREMAILRDILYDPAQSLVEALRDKAEGDTAISSVSFENGREQIRQYLATHIEPGVTLQSVRQALKFANELNDFCEKMEQTPGFRGVEWDAHRTKLLPLFMAARNEEDTSRAIYRLVLVGLVEDFTADYHANRFELTVIKRADEKYVEFLQHYVGLYVSRRETELVRERVLARAELTILEKCLGYLLEFVYDKIAKKRRASIEIMESAALEGSLDKRAFAERVNTYFNSSYLPDLRTYRIEYSIDTVWRFVHEVEEASDTNDRAKHLRGACDRLIAENPDNGAFYVLRAYTILVLSAPSNQMAADFQRGWQLFQESGMNRSEIARQMSRFYESVVRLNPGISGEQTKALILDNHRDWLTSFNARYFDGVTVGG